MYHRVGHWQGIVLEDRGRRMLIRARGINRAFGSGALSACRRMGLFVDCLGSRLLAS